MTTLTPVSALSPVYQIEATDEVLGGPGQVANLQAQALLNRTEWLRARWAEFAPVEYFRQPGDPDDTLAIQRGIDAGFTVTLLAGKTYVAANIVSKPGAGLVCLGGRATVNVAAGAGYSGIVITDSNFVVSGINFFGGNTGPWNVATPPATDGRVGISVGNGVGTGLQIHGISMQDCDIYGFGGKGFDGREVQVGFEFGKRVTLENINCYDNYINWNYGTNFEYATTTNCYGYRGFIGVVMQGGNNSVTASHYEWNYYNCQLAAGVNDAHGQFVACSFNHAIGVGLAAANITAGHLFIACAFWYSNIQLVTSTGVMIRNCQIAGGTPLIYIEGGGINCIDDNYTPNGLTKTFVGNVFTTFRNNRTTVADAAVGPKCKDITMQAATSTFGYPLAWNATADTGMGLIFTTKKYMGEDASFLSPTNDAYIPRAGFYDVTARVTFNNGAVVERAVLKMNVVRTGSTVETHMADKSAAASATDCTARLVVRLFLLAGDLVQFTLRSMTVTGFTVPAGGIFVTVNSAE